MWIPIRSSSEERSTAVREAHTICQPPALTQANSGQPCAYADISPLFCSPSTFRQRLANMPHAHYAAAAGTPGKRTPAAGRSRRPLPLPPRNSPNPAAVPATGSPRTAKLPTNPRPRQPLSTGRSPLRRFPRRPCVRNTIVRQLPPACRYHRRRSRTGDLRIRRGCAPLPFRPSDGEGRHAPYPFSSLP